MDKIQKSKHLSYILTYVNNLYHIDLCDENYKSECKYLLTSKQLKTFLLIMKSNTYAILFMSDPLFGDICKLKLKYKSTIYNREDLI